ncbi:DASH complex subunit Dam1-domain-containing protein [Phanerochaete sordida]|uniref:DASH complex subunit DAM1 n=1 Tax=Phanerochaete sordida TaxID=48140 RepID=A0A9P3LAU0_9APHY|nr:DASH complex subunit Dam1-domain-containing protein [Phanerochaete sordida]
MATALTPHRTPLRRLSQGSLFRLSRSGAHADAPHGLGFLGPALGELLDEAEALQGNVAGLRALGGALAAFNESFASWLYVLNMNALTTDWPQAPTDASFELARRRAEEDALAAMEAMKAAQAAQAAPEPSSVAEKTSYGSEQDTDTTYNEHANATTSSAATTAPKSILKKKTGGKQKLTAKEKKERGVAVERIVNSLPLEFRGNDPNLRRHIELVIEGFLDREGRGVALPELIRPPDLNQARVNKCLIALVNRKIVRKDNSTGSVLYHWHGLPS